MAKLFLSVRVPEESYSVVPLEDVDLTETVKYLREKVSQKIDFPINQIVLMYCGSVLEDSEVIREVDVKPCTIIHVFPKTTSPKDYVPTKAYSDEECDRIAELFGTVTGTQINVNTRIRILHKIIAEYPEFRRNLGAQALIRDSILFHTLSKAKVIKLVAKFYPIIYEAAEFIVKTTKKEIAKNEKITFGDETFSDQTSSSEEENVSQSEQARIRRISRNQLTAALMMAGTSLNSLPNIAQRNASLAEEQQTPDQSQNPSSSSGQALSPSRITPLLFSAALNQALSAATNSRSDDGDQTQAMDTSEPQQPVEQQPPPPSSASGGNASGGRFSNELQVMREMGLLDERINLQALVVSNGDIQTAVNLVLGTMSSLFN